MRYRLKAFAGYDHPYLQPIVVRDSSNLTLSEVMADINVFRFITDRWEVTPEFEPNDKG